MASAKEFTTDLIRNVVVVGHGGCGKTSLIDALSFVSGTNARHGKVDEQSSISMYRPEEKSHEMSMYCTPAFAEWKRYKINLLDTPGYLDFFGEVDAAMRVASAGLVVINAQAGMEIGTQQVWERLDKCGLPRMLFISRMDKDGADFESAWQSVSESLGKNTKFLPLQVPMGHGEGFKGVLDLLDGEAHHFDGAKGEFSRDPIPDALQEAFETQLSELQESVAETDEALLDVFFEEGSLTREQLIKGLSKAILSGDIVPVICGSSITTYGTQQLMQAIIEFMPDPTSRVEVATKDGEEVTLEAKDEADFTALVFKTSIESHVGELSYFKVMSGAVSNGDEVYNTDTSTVEKFSHLSIPHGRNRLEVDRLHAGDIGVITKMRNTHTNNSISTKSTQYQLAQIVFPSPDTRIAIAGLTHADDDKLGQALAKLKQEDPTFSAAFDSELRQTIARGLGDLHLQVQFEKLKERYNVNVSTAEPHIAYRETIKATAEAQGRHKKQTGGKGQFGDCHLRLRPRERGEGYEFVDAIVGGVIPSKFIPAVDKGVRESAERGFLAGFPVVDFACECFFGSYHSVDSSEMAFKVAGSLGFRKAMEKAKPCLLEPVLFLEVTVPSESMGDISGDISNRRGRIQGMDTMGDRTIIKAIAPEAELFGYAAAIRSMTRGLGFHTRRFYGYEEVPSMIANKIIAEREKEKEEE
ncbi:elongation factor G [Myxococcota bacterium]|nr:elongation factor G [Myxococcota bacterium]MBU1432485.1 elongation factor G [Myxococcota bacterium]MBU1899645.1 elongation factor G [Myxococcota bacterium]